MTEADHVRNTIAAWPSCPCIESRVSEHARCMPTATNGWCDECPDNHWSASDHHPISSSASDHHSISSSASDHLPISSSASDHHPISSSATQTRPAALSRNKKSMKIQPRGRGVINASRAMRAAENENLASAVRTRTR